VWGEFELAGGVALASEDSGHAAQTPGGRGAAEGGDSRVGLGVAGHFDEAETFASAGLTVADDLRRLHLAVCAEQLLKLRGFDFVAQITDI